MKSSILKKLQSVYTPVIYSETKHIELMFSPAQIESARSYVHDSLQTLKSLCQKLVLDVRQILITACEIVEMLARVPSVAESNRMLDMNQMVCCDVRKLAALMDSYDKNPKNVSSSMIQMECNALASCLPVE
jgi:hypothetical protein